MSLLCAENCVNGESRRWRSSPHAIAANQSVGRVDACTEAPRHRRGARKRKDAGRAPRLDDGENVVRCQMHEARRAGAVLVAALHREGLARRRLAIRKNRAVDAAERAVDELSTNALVDVLRGAVLAVDRIISKGRPSNDLLAVRLVDVLALDAPRARALLAPERSYPYGDSELRFGHFCLHGWCLALRGRPFGARKVKTGFCVKCCCGLITARRRWQACSSENWVAESPPLALAEVWYLVRRA